YNPENAKPREHQGVSLWLRNRRRPNANLRGRVQAREKDVVVVRWVLGEDRERRVARVEKRREVVELMVCVVAGGVIEGRIAKPAHGDQGPVRELRAIIVVPRERCEGRSIDVDGGCLAAAAERYAQAQLHREARGRGIGDRPGEVHDRRLATGVLTPVEEDDAPGHL